MSNYWRAVGFDSFIKLSCNEYRFVCLFQKEKLPSNIFFQIIVSDKNLPIFYNQFQTMTQLVDFINEIQASFTVHSLTEISQNEKNTFSNQSTINTIFAEKFEKQITHKSFNFLQMDPIRSVIVTLSQSDNLIKVVFKLVKISEIFRIQSTFLKTYLIGLFAKGSYSFLMPKLNPKNGQIYLQNEFLTDNSQQNLSLQSLNRIVDLNIVKNRVVQFWQMIISICQGKFQLQKDLSTKQKATQISLLSALSRKENESESIYNLKTYFTNSQKQTPQITQKIKKYLHLSKFEQKPIVNWQYRRKLDQVLKQKKALEQNTIRSVNTYSNFQELNINQKQKSLIVQKINESKANDQTFKVNDSKFGKVFLSYQKQNPSKVRSIINSLNSIGKNRQYNFLNYYFLLINQQRKYIMNIALRKTTLGEFLERNALSLSFQAKLKIFLQVFYALQQIWQKLKFFPGNVNIADVSITKTLIVKIDSIHKWVKLEEDQQEMSDLQRLQCKAQLMTSLHAIFMQIFYQKNNDPARNYRISKKPTKVNSDIKDLLDHRIVDQKRHYSSLYGVSEILSSVAFCFEKYQSDLIQIQQTRNSSSLDEITTIRQKVKKGNFDLILGTIFRSVELLKSIS